MGSLKGLVKFLLTRRAKLVLFVLYSWVCTHGRLPLQGRFRNILWPPPGRIGTEGADLVVEGGGIVYQPGFIQVFRLRTS